MNTLQIDSISGLVAGLSTTLITHPLDLIKVRLQLSTSNQPLRHILQNISKNSQSSKHYILSELYKGLSPNIIGNITGWSLYFTLYEQFKTSFSQSPNTIKYFSASTVSGLVTSLLTNPVWVIKTRLLSEKSRYSSMADAIRKIYTEEGVKTFWKGSVPSLFSVFQNSLQFTVYDHLKNSKLLDNLKNDHEIQYYFTASSISKFTAMLVMYPFQVVRSNLQKFDSTNIYNELRYLYGTNGFYKGFTVSLLKVLPATSITLITYESMRNWLTRINEKI
ncbi:hypothetical protein CANTEDRAFT_102320 [Yamadazyma tenuis ATCC 10573]|uniref:Mitochondrial thiamine pyrophosphate carrier 1 n=1 Tax=Candida tenuis (strain ATCC 10573 / BCRC 21748 / CBS 615 / JCM 9827 / NBRC 10315 / NRRL Y-1498 / VKM Y-70) TaxID=590646 RepID=G3AYP9_CANTC|nr:uncharacterized protein CANTEDRAFT_102320 [Yamadazyma tenuis ATCC 10573]EGV65901.1 hypothetical protein CANTEDRAFT_102320 [Yamadazyma tenuis ATCC 10573]